MSSPVKKNNIVEKPLLGFFALTLFALPGFLPASQTAFARQDDLRKTVYGGESKTKKPNGKATFSAKPSPTAPKKRKTVSAKSGGRLLEVVFTTQEPRAEIWLNNRSIGLTDAKSQLKKNLPAGLYQVMVKKGAQVLHPVQAISVNAEQTSFRLLREAVKTVVVQPPATTAENPKPKTNQELALEISEKVKQTLEDYSDPAKTDTVTTEDWELVLQAAQLGQLQSYTAVQIEAQRWFASGQIELAKNNYTNAFTAFNKSLEFMPNSALPFYALGSTYLANKQPVEAIKALQRALQLKPDMAMAYRKFADAQRLSGKEKEAINAYKFAIQYGYRTPETRFYLATMLSKTGKFEDAIKEFNEVLKETPTVDAYIARGDAYQSLKRDVSALESYQKALDLDPNSAVAFANLGDVFYKQREYVKSKESFEKALELDPGGKNLNVPETQKKMREAASKIK